MFDKWISPDFVYFSHPIPSDVKYISIGSSIAPCTDNNLIIDELHGPTGHTAKFEMDIFLRYEKITNK